MQGGALRRAGWLAALSMFGLSGCGGGGGDSNPAASGPLVVLDSPSQVRADVMETGSMPEVTLSGHATGDVSSLAGKTIYVTVEDTASLFQTAPGSFFVRQTGNNGISFTLTGQTQTATGHKSGSMRVFVCLDAACQQPLRGSPISVPYDVTVWPRLALSANLLRVETTFGAAPVTGSLPVSLPAFLSEWRVIGGYAGDWLGTITPETGSGTQGAAVVGFRPVAPGTYSTTVYADTTSKTPGSPEVRYTEPFTIEYVVAPSASVGMVFDRAQLSQEHKLNDWEWVPYGYNTVLSPGATTQFVGVEYLSHPASANGHSHVAAWVDSTYWRTRSCRVYLDISAPGGAAGDCLPVGFYQARIAYDVAYNGTTTRTYLPISMTVVP